jgi:uncharacterized RmlC-like cupin family protein
MHMPQIRSSTRAAAPCASPEGEIVTIRPERTTDTKQGLPIFQGISGENSGARRLCLNKVVIPAGAAAHAHLHRDHETALYLLQGRVETFYGEGLSKSVVNEAGDFIYIPAGVPHKPVNLSQTEPAIAIVARTDPNEQESVEPVAEPEEGAGA